ALRSRVVTLPHYRSEDTAEAIARHQIMVAKLKAFVNYPAQTFQDYPETDTSFPARYARAIAYYKSSDTTRAMTTLESLLKDNPENPYLWELKGQIYYETGKPADAEGPQRKALALKPDASLLQVSLGQTLIATNDAAKVDEAVVLLRTVVRGEPDEPMAWRLLSQAYDFKGQDAMARLAAAEQNFAIGNVKQSRIFAMRARELLPRNSPEWRRATDIVLVSDPDKSDLDRLSRDSGSGLH
ncbi:MAG: tetratricopeptide repeat protein, partial [Caulobacteraceae bacterium]